MYLNIQTRRHINSYIYNVILVFFIYLSSIIHVIRMKISFFLFFFLIKITNTNLGFVLLFYRQRIGRMLVEVFRTAANNGTKLNVNEVMQSVQQIVEDPGKFKIYFFPPFLITCTK